MNILEINYLDIEQNESYEALLNKVIEVCFKEEKLEEKNLYINIVLTNPANIKKINKEYRGIDKETDVLSFPMFEQKELTRVTKFMAKEVLGDIVISIKQVQNQAIEYEHSFERELSYMAVHGFYHLMGYDHIEEKDKKIMRQKEEKILQELNIIQ